MLELSILHPLLMYTCHSNSMQLIIAVSCVKGSKRIYRYGLMKKDGTTTCSFLEGTFFIDKEVFYETIKRD
jgi:hypothetical protein